MKFSVSLLLFFIAISAGTAQLNTTLLGQLDYEQTANDVWGYAAPDGTEYALVGTRTGLSIVTLADPENPQELFFFPGTETTWRDIQTRQVTDFLNVLQQEYR